MMFEDILGAPAAPAPPPQQQNSSPWMDILRAALPAVAGFYAGRQGNLGAYVQGMEQTRARQTDEAMARQRLDMQRQQMEAQQAAADENRKIRMEAQQARVAQEQARMAAAQEAAAEKQRKEEGVLIQRHLDQAANNPTTNALIAAFGPEAFSVKVPGIGTMTLAEAQARGAVVPGKLGVLPSELRKEKKAPSLVDDYQPDGSIKRVEDKPGLVRHGRPRAPEKADKPVKRAYTWKDDDPASDTYGQSFRIVEDEDGNQLSKTKLSGADVKPVASHVAGAPMKVGRFTVTVK